MLSDYARENIFLPLGMKETHVPAAGLAGAAHRAHRAARSRTAPPLRGVVHDPTARYMGGVAGHAGLFSTADDLARFAQMMLNGGELDGVRAVQPAHRGEVHRAADARPTSRFCAASAGISIRRIRAIAASCFPIGSYGHTGFTGTSIWIDPSTEDLRHPAGQQRASRSRGRRSRRCARKVATIVGGGAGDRARGRHAHRLQRDAGRGGRAPRGRAQRRDADRARRAGGREVPAVRAASASG